MADWQLGGYQRIVAVGENTADSLLTNITAGGSANTKGSYTQIVASTPMPASAIAFVRNRGSAVAEYFVDFAIGAPTEEVIIENLMCVVPNQNERTGHTPWIPLDIPEGTEISARCQSSTASATIYVACMLAVGGPPAPSSGGRIITYGADTTNTRGTQVDPGGSANTKGTPAQITSATTRPHKGFFIAFDNDTNSAAANAAWLFDVLLGAPTEEVKCENLSIRSGSSIDRMHPAYIHIPVAVPEGSEISVQAQCDITDSTDRLVYMTFYGY